MHFLMDYGYQVGAYLAGGGLVMIPLLTISLVMWLLIIYRAVFLRQLYFKNMPRQQAGELIQANQWPAPRYRGINAEMVRRFLSKRSADPELDAYLLDETVMSLVTSLDRYQSVITVLAGLAPLLGLLGTVTGMIGTFEVITLFGTGNVKAMAGGISEALITTQTGLLISIPGFYMSGFLERRSNTLKQRAASVGIYLKRFLQA